MYNTITHERYQDKQRIFDTFEPSAPFQTVVSPFIILDTKNNSAVSSNHILDNNLKMAQDLIRQNNLPQAEIYLQRYLALNEHNFFSRQLLNDLRHCITNHLQHSRVIISLLNLRRTCPTHFSNINNWHVAIHFACYEIMSKRIRH